ncbi:hypothetical protein H5410_028392 [Solanum commersonii]|uniref:Uncharacterized protein n=1 Tax=Solanum commersonii TaxID=4109 RepID=A0A9J5Z609_SOLCO|nr:hypothetical protein H5410_028392 [Solanum commersonii]
MNLIHMGLVVIGLKGLTRKNLGTKVLITLYDSRWSESKRSIIGLPEVDMSNNGGIFYCSPDFIINSKEFGKYIKIGIQTKGYEEMNCGNNLLVCVGFIGKLATNNSSRFKIKIDDAVGIMGNKGIKLMNPLKINSEEYAGREWNLEKFCKKEVLRPNDHLTYTNTKGETSIRFTDYKYTDQKEIDEELEDNESTINMEDNYGYRQKEDTQEASDDETTRSLKEFMETVSSSSSPFEKTTSITPVEYTIGNLPRHRVYRQDPTTKPEMVKSIGIRMPIETLIKLQDGGDRGKILNITAHDPQLWNSVIDGKGICNKREREYNLLDLALDFLV